MSEVCTIEKTLSLVSRRGECATCTLTLKYVACVSATLQFSCDRVQLPYTFDCPSVFHCIYAFRRALEEAGWILCCNASRPDARVMGMLGDVSNGLRCYLLKSAPKGLPPRIVEMFEAAPASDVTTIAEQEKFFSAWRAKAAVDQRSN